MTTSSPITLRDFEHLGRLRDDLRLQAHLFGAELKDRWQEAEVRWEHVESEVRTIGAVVDHTRTELSAAASLAVDALREAYADMRKVVKDLKEI